MRLTQLHVYPIKSLKGIALQAAEYAARGLKHDRRWMLVDAHGVALTQRDYAQLALLETLIDDDVLRVLIEGDQHIVIPPGGGAPLNVEIWGEQVRAETCGAQANNGFSEYLQTDCRIVYMPDSVVRSVDAASAISPEDRVGFADCLPLLLISQASLTLLNSKLATPVDMRRFRPNLVIDDCEPHEEDAWRRVSIGPAQFHVVEPCSRCSMTTVDPDTGIVSQEPLRTLARYRKQANHINFGQLLIPVGEGRLRLEDEVTVLE